MKKKCAILLVSHGSQSSETLKEITDLTMRLKAAQVAQVVEFAFLDIESPDIPQGIKNCIDQGADDVLVLLNFLNSGQHVDKDIPRIVNEAQKKFPKVLIKMSRPIGQHPGVIDLFIDLIRSHQEK